MSDAVFVVNPASANGSTGKRWPELARRAAQAGLNAPTLMSERPGGVTELARQAAAEGVSLVVAVGGDGTVHEAANGLLGSQTELGIIPRGTGTDFVRTFGIPTRLDKAVEVITSGGIRSIDVGKVGYRAWDGSEGTAHFAGSTGPV